MGVRLEVGGLSVQSGTSVDFTDYSPMQATVMPVVSLQESRLDCWGTAACVGNAGWFVTAKHVTEQFVAKYGPRDCSALI